MLSATRTRPTTANAIAVAVPSSRKRRGANGDDERVGPEHRGEVAETPEREGERAEDRIDRGGKDQRETRSADPLPVAAEQVDGRRDRVCDGRGHDDRRERAQRSGAADEPLVQEARGEQGDADQDHRPRSLRRVEANEVVADVLQQGDAERERRGELELTRRQQETEEQHTQRDEHQQRRDTHFVPVPAAGQREQPETGGVQRAEASEPARAEAKLELPGAHRLEKRADRGVDTDRTSRVPAFPTAKREDRARGRRSEQ
jgi:hypothetical protein